MKNLSYAVAIIAALSLLLGLSLGQNYQLQQQLYQMEMPGLGHPAVVDIRLAPEAESCRHHHWRDHDERMERLEQRLRHAREMIEQMHIRRSYLIEE